MKTKATDQNQVITVYIPRSLAYKARVLAALRDTSRSALIVEALKTEVEKAKELNDSIEAKRC